MDTLSILLISLVVLLLFGVPVYMVLISSTMISLFAFSSLPLTVIHNALFEGLNSFPLLAIPCFVVAGTLMEQGGVTGQIIDVVKMLVGRMYGGLGITTIMACTFFAAISGSGPGTVAAGNAVDSVYAAPGVFTSIRGVRLFFRRNRGHPDPTQQSTHYLRHHRQCIHYGIVYRRLYSRLYRRLCFDTYGLVSCQT